MASAKSEPRAKLAHKVRELRLARRWTQAELAGRLGLSQNRLSEIERGGGSFTAEQFLDILRLFNVGPEHFGDVPAPRDAALQNALARLGAAHLREREDVLPSERLRELGSLVREVLTAPDSPRLVTALAPALVRSGANLSANKLAQLQGELAEAGLPNRLGWLIDNTLEAIELDRDPPREWAQLYRRSELTLRTFLGLAQEAKRARGAGQPDLLDGNIRSGKSLAEVRAAASTVSRRWDVVTTLQPADFLEALRGARAAG